MKATNLLHIANIFSGKIDIWKGQQESRTIMCHLLHQRQILWLMIDYWKRLIIEEYKNSKSLVRKPKSLGFHYICCITWSSWAIVDWMFERWLSGKCIACQWSLLLLKYGCYQLWNIFIMLGILHWHCILLLLIVFSIYDDKYALH